MSWGAAVGGIAAAAAGIYGANEASSGAATSNAWNVQQSRERMAVQERLSNTAHQREVKDLKAAGLNPLLAMNTGASTPAGSQGVVSNPESESSSILAGATSSAIEAGMASTGLKNLKKQGSLIAAQSSQSSASAQLTKEKARKEKVSADWLESILGKGNVDKKLNKWKVDEAIRKHPYSHKPIKIRRD